jgi:redox-sensitive bicupin YhaK (pirin superfamily)
MRSGGAGARRQTDRVSEHPGCARSVQVRRADERFRTATAGVETRHCFSFGRHYDPAHVAHGPLLLCDEHALQPDAGFAPHPHRGVEIVTWVLEGALEHAGPAGTARVEAGTAQRLTAGTGITHAERAAGAATRFVQAWLVPDQPGLPPSYEQVAVPPERLKGTLVPVVSGLGHEGAAALGARAALHVGRLAPGQLLTLPAAPYVHLLVTRGEVRLAGAGSLRRGDSARLTGAGEGTLSALAPAEVLVWEMHVTPGGGAR